MTTARPIVRHGDAQLEKAAVDGVLILINEARFDRRRQIYMLSSVTSSIPWASAVVAVQSAAAVKSWAGFVGACKQP